MSTAIVFKNFSKEEFRWKWDGAEYVFPAGVSMMMEDWKAQFFAKHLVDREMQRLDKDAMWLQDPRRNELLAQALPSGESLKTENDSQLETAILNQEFSCPECDFTSKSSRGLNIHMKKHEKAEETEEEFEEV